MCYYIDGDTSVHKIIGLHSSVTNSYSFCRLNYDSSIGYFLSNINLYACKQVNVNNGLVYGGKSINSIGDIDFSGNNIDPIQYNSTDSNFFFENDDAIVFDLTNCDVSDLSRNDIIKNDTSIGTISKYDNIKYVINSDEQIVAVFIVDSYNFSKLNLLCA